MFWQSNARAAVVALALLLTLGLSAAAPLSAQEAPVPERQDKAEPARPEKVAAEEPAREVPKNEADKKDDADKEKSKSGNKAMPEGAPVFWRDPGDVSSRDLSLGPGGGEMKPDLSNVTFVEEETGGYSVKYRVRDGAGKTWVAKLGKEAQPETAAVRLVWAAGYPTEISYLAPCVVIKGAPQPLKEVERCGEGGFANVRFEARPDEVKRVAEWKWDDNPFAGQREFKGLVVLMALLNNWDLKDSNNKVLHVADKGELHYVVSDLGATFGKTGNFITHNRNEPKDYAKSRFVEKVEGGKVKFAYDGKNKGLFEDVTVEDARWIGGLLSKLTDEQIRAAFVAANYAEADLDLLVSEVRSRINELASL